MVSRCSQALCAIKSVSRNLAKQQDSKHEKVSANDGCGPAWKGTVLQVASDDHITRPLICAVSDATNKAGAKK